MNQNEEGTRDAERVKRLMPILLITSTITLAAIAIISLMRS